MSDDEGFRISEVSRSLGVPAPTLRSWERRYGVPASTRTVGGHRRYAHAELHQLKLMRDEIARGLGAGEAARSVRRLLTADTAGSVFVTSFLLASERQEAAHMAAVLDDVRATVGLAATIDLVVMPSMRQIGAWWSTGRCGVAQEHLATATVRRWLARTTTLSVGVAHDSPTLLACGPLDQHSIGLEALAALLADRGRGSRLMGARTSARTLVAATIATEAVAVVVVSHLSAQRRPAVQVLRAVVRTDAAVFYAGNAFTSAEQRLGVPGTYLGDSVSDAATVLIDRSRDSMPSPRRSRSVV